MKVVMIVVFFRISQMAKPSKAEPTIPKGKLAQAD